MSWFSIPVSLAAINAPADTILGVDSEANRDISGNPIGGGTAAVDPPCRYYSDGTDSFNDPPGFIRIWWGGWQPSSPLSGGRYGFAWHWHGDRFTVGFCDGHAKACPETYLTEGCNVQDSWNGYITNPAMYHWGLQ